MLDQTLNRDSCNELIEIILQKPGIRVIVLGPEGCLRVLFFRVLRAGLLERFNGININSLDLVTGRHMDKLRGSLVSLLEEKKDTLGIVIYTSCADIITGTDFRGICREMEATYKVPVKILNRGPLTKRKVKPRERVPMIFSEIDEFHKKSGRTV